ncbi:hypothetical protein [Arthrobacter sp. Alg241-R88]|uniref:hypothetical protein n=1 Tax=Arthrobacter sp. Alg241-R88 TaxID=2305984 RepID=UPI0013D67E74|nr:hypothetical protein [Arthrobacter sp. Alg241-R88]
MAKIRGIKPETWTDDKFVQLSPLARLLFIGMWNLACDNGHVEDNAVQLKIRLLPMDPCTVPALVDEMVLTGQVERHEGYLKVIKLAEHQHIDMRWLSICEWCEHDEHSAYKPTQKKPRKASAPSALDEQPASTPRALDADGDVDGELKVSGSDAAPGVTSTKKKAASRKRPATPLPSDWQPTEQHWEKRHDAIDVEREATKFRLHAEANDRRQVSWNAAFSQWLLNARPDPRSTKPRNLPNVHDLERPPDGLSPDEYAQWEYERRQKRGRA